MIGTSEDACAIVGGQMWGWYDKQGNTVPKNKLTRVASDITTVVAIPVSAPFALSDVLSSDTFELLMKIGGNKNEKVFDDISIIPSWLLLA